jgi:hypothetical protein
MSDKMVPVVVQWRLPSLLCTTVGLPTIHANKQWNVGVQSGQDHDMDLVHMASASELLHDTWRLSSFRVVDVVGDGRWYAL